jgi:hypothetical protein
MPDRRRKVGDRALYNRSRITNGRELLPSVDLRGVWGRLLRDNYHAMVAHCGGADTISEPQRMASRRVAVLETELCFLEDKMARIRQEGGEPQPNLLDLYARLAGQQKRQNEIIGLDRHQRDVTPSLRELIQTRTAEDIEEAE